MNQKILVIGASGLLGKPVAHRLKNSGYSVRNLAHDIAEAARLFGDEFEIVKGNVEDVAKLEKAMESCFGIHINLSGGGRTNWC